MAFDVSIGILVLLVATTATADATDEDTLMSLWRLELPSILGVAMPGSEVLDEESVSVDMDYDSSEEARYEQACIEAEVDHERLMECSTASEAAKEVERDSEHAFPCMHPVAEPELYYNSLLPDNVDLGCFQPRTYLESAAKKALARGMIPGVMIARLADELPTSLRNIHGCGNFGSHLSPRAFTAGAYIHGPHAGMHLATSDFEILALVLISVVRGMRPEMYFSSVSLLRNIQSTLHRDCHNHARSTSMVLPVTMFSGGELFIEDKQGSSFMGSSRVAGSVHPLISDQEPCPVEFNPRLWHCNLPWGGERVVLVAYHIRNPELLPPHVALRLSQMGFRLRRK